MLVRRRDDDGALRIEHYDVEGTLLEILADSTTTSAFDTCCAAGMQVVNAFLLDSSPEGTVSVVVLGWASQSPEDTDLYRVDIADEIELTALTEPDQGGDRGRVALDHAFELDEAPGFERFFFVTSEPGEQLPVTEVLEAARKLAQSEDAKSAALELPQSWKQSSLLLDKSR